MARSSGKRIVVSVNLPEGLYRELLRLLETGDYVHFSDLVRAALRFYIDYHRRLRAGQRAIGLTLG